MRRKKISIIGALVLGLVMSGCGSVATHLEAGVFKANEYSELYSATFNSVSDHSYTQNKTFTLSNKSWTASVSQKASGVFYLGCNSKNASKGILGDNESFSDINAALIATGDHYTNGTNHAYALRFDNAYNNVSKVEFNWAGGNNAFQVHLFGKTSTGYVHLNVTNYATSGETTAGSVDWTGTATNYTGFAIVARPGNTNTNGTSKTLRPSTFKVYRDNKTLSSIALSGTYPTVFTQGDSFSHDGMVVTASYSDSSSTDVTSSATFSGYNMSTVGNQTVTVSYTEVDVTKTATYGITINASQSPFIVPTKNSTSGFTGQKETLSFTYGSINSLSVVSNNTSVVTVGTPSLNNGVGNVQINFVGEGTTNVVFKNGSDELASVSVSVSLSTVSISGLSSNAKTFVGKTLNLASQLTIETTGSCTSAVSWLSNNSGVASVDENGVVTGVSRGTATITVTSIDYPTATMQCAVKVLSYGTELNPLTVDDAREALGVTGAQVSEEILTVTGIVTESSYDSSKDQYTIWLQSNDGETPKSFELYHIKFDYTIFDEDSTDAYHATNSLAGYTVVARGYGKVFNSSTYELCDATISGDKVYPSIIALVAPAQITATDISLNKSNVSVVSGEMIELVYSLVPEGATSEVTWESSDENVAVVNEFGVVKGIASGSATITAKVTDSIKAECSVTVGASNTKVLLPANSVEEGDVVYLCSPAVNNQYNGQSGNGSFGVGQAYTDSPNVDLYALAVEIGNTNDSFSFRIVSSDDNNGKYLNWNSGNELRADTYKTNNSSWVIENDANGNPLIKNKADTNRAIWWNVSSPRFACYTGKSNNDSYKYAQLFKHTSVNDCFANNTTFATLQATETEENSVISVADVSMRFGIRMSIVKWGALNARLPITRYGVKLFRAKNAVNTYSETAVKDRYMNSQALTDIYRESSEAPTPEDDYYEFTAQINVTDASQYGKYIFAAAYIVAGGNYYFFGETHASVHSLAEESNWSLSDEAIAILKA